MGKTSTSPQAGKRHAAAQGCPDDCPLVFVCRKCSRSEKVADFLRRRTPARVITVRCQKVCDSPVAGLLVDGHMEWFARTGSPKALDALARQVSNPRPHRLPKPLRKRRSKKRSGRNPR